VAILLSDVFALDAGDEPDTHLPSVQGDRQMRCG